jgi:alpha-beta hydrolase superfamily lysophospholipase
MQKVRFKTEDGLEIVGNYFPTEKNDAPAVVLLHMMPEVKESWNDFARKLNNEGFQCLAIDLRGHGESGGGPDGSRKFSDEEHQKSINDVFSAVEFFVDKGIPVEKISLVGASIGANLSIIFQSGNKKIKACVALSPGLNYRGIEIEHSAKDLKEEQAIFLVAGGESDEYSTETVIKIFDSIKCNNKKKMIFDDAGHGTAIFNSELALEIEIINWLKEVYF